jgi:hypothetical protein
MATRKKGTGYRRRALPVGMIPLSYALNFSGLGLRSPSHDERKISTATTLVTTTANTIRLKIPGSQGDSPAPLIASTPPPQDYQNFLHLISLSPMLAEQNAIIDEGLYNLYYWLSTFSFALLSAP